MILTKEFRLETNTTTKKTEVLITRKALAEYYLNVSANQLVSYTKANQYNPPLLPVNNAEYGFKDRKVWYNHLEALQWHKENISQKNSPKADKYSGLQSEDDYQDYNPYVDKITTQNVKIAKELENALNEKIKREQSSIELEILKKNYIPIEEADKTVATSVRVLLSELYNMIENLPSRLNDCSNIDEIKNVLEDEFEDLINEIRSKLVGLSEDE